MNDGQQNTISEVRRHPVKSGRRSPWVLISAWAVLLALALLAVPAAFHWGKRLVGDANVLAAAAVAFAVTLAFSLTLYWFTRRFVIHPRQTS